jgi:hypothetical protein
MENLPEDQQVVELLSKLKRSSGGYPSDMLASRRRTYLRQMANVGLGIGIGAGLKHTFNGGGNGAGAASTVSSKILEMALIAAIAVEAGTVAYLYREKIVSALTSYGSTPAVQEVSSLSGETSFTNPVSIEAVGTPSIASSATPSPTQSGTPSGTVSTSVAGGNNQNNNDDEGTNSSITANGTPNPGGNQGNQYGLTPQPVRTTENNGGGEGSNNNDSSGGGGGSGNNNGGGGGGNSNRP